MRDVFDNKQILPKVWLAYIQKYWLNGGIPKNYPDSSSEFSIINDPELNEIIDTMINSVGTDAQPFPSSAIPDNCTIGAYLGTYDVEGEAGVETLLSPVKVPNNTVSVIGIHYNADEETWDVIEDAHVVDGYVFGTLDSFSPIAVFTCKKDTYITSDYDIFAGNEVYVANGIPIVIEDSSNGSTFVTDANGKSVQVNSNTVIIGGTIDGSDVESTSIVVKSGNIKRVYGGSIGTEETTPRIGQVNVVTNGVSNITLGICGAGYRNKVDHMNFSIKNSTLKFVGNGNSIVKINGVQKDSCDGTSFDLVNCNEWVKDYQLEVDNCNITILYCSSNNGLAYTLNGSVKVTNSEIGYMSCCGSNGRTDNIKLYAENCKFNNCFETTNRGTVGSVDATLKNISCSVFAIFGDSTDNEVNGSIENVKLDINGENTDITVYAGTQGGSPVTKEIAKAAKIKISRFCKVQYNGDSEAVLKDSVVIK